MKGDVFGLTRTMIIVIAIIALFIFSMFFATQYGVAQGILGCGDTTRCEPGETATFCDECKEPEGFLIPEHLIIFKDDFVSNLAEITEYIKYPSEDVDKYQNGEECISCTECWDSQDYSGGWECEECDGCDPMTEECEMCTTCKQAISDHYTMDISPVGDGITYSSCEFCANCKSCATEEDNTQADNCGSCSYCTICEKEDTRNYDICDYCSFQNYDNSNNIVATGCSMCYNNDGTEFLETSKMFNICKSCQSCNMWEEIEPTFCDRVKKCIANYDSDNPEPCIIEYNLPASDATLESALKFQPVETWQTSLNYIINNALAKCIDGPIFSDIGESGKQFVCNYEKSEISFPLLLEHNQQVFNRQEQYGFPKYMFSGVEWSGDRDATYAQCGGIGYSLNRLYVNSWAFGTPEGMNYRIAIGDVDHGITTDGKCRINMFICAQPAFAVLNSENDIQSTYENSRIKIYSSILSMDETQFKFFEEAPKQAIKSSIIEVDVGNDQVPIVDIADAIVVGVNDWIVLSETDPNTIDNVFNIIDKNGDIGSFGDIIVKKIKINDRFSSLGMGIHQTTVPYKELKWKLIPVDPSLRANIYGNLDLFYVTSYQTNTETADSHEYSVPYNPLKANTLGYGGIESIADSVIFYPIEARFVWTHPYDCTDKTDIDVSESGIEQADWKNVKSTNERSFTLTHNEDHFDSSSYKMNAVELSDTRAYYDNLYGRSAYRIKNEGCDIATSMVYLKYSLGTWGNEKFIFYETSDTGNYSGKIQIQVGFYVESEKLRMQNEPYLYPSYTVPENYIDDTLVLTPMVSIRQVS